MPKSRYEEVYPCHKCSQCGLEHVLIPAITSKSKNEKGEDLDVAFIPFEVIGVVDGMARPGDNMPNFNTPAYVYGLLWGTPGTRDVKHCSVLYMN